MVDGEDQENGKDKSSFEDIEVPFMGRGIAIEASRKLDQTID